MSKFSNIIKAANVSPRWPVKVNRQSAQARGLVGCWTGFAPGGNGLLDLSGNLLNGDSSPITGWEAGAPGSGQSAMRFTGGTYATLPSSLPNLTANWTIAAWVYRNTDVGTGAPLWSRWTNTSTARELYIYFINATLVVDIPFIEAIMSSSAGTVPLGEWIHVAVTRSGSSWVGYINGKSVCSATSATAQENGPGVEIGKSTPQPTAILDGRIQELRAYNRGLSSAEVWALYDPATRYELYQEVGRRAHSFLPPAALTHYTLTADVGTFTEAGQAANLLYGRKLTSDVGTFTLAGQAANLLYARLLAADVGAFTLTGQDAGLLKGKTLTADVGTFALSGQDVAFRTGYALTADTGVFTESGQTADLRTTKILSAAHGSFTLSGQDATLTAAGVVTIPSGRLFRVSRETRIFRVPPQ